MLLRGSAGVHALNLPAAPKTGQLDFARYRKLIIRASSNIFALLGISEGLLGSLVGGEGVPMELEGITRVGLPGGMALPGGEVEEREIKAATWQAVAERVGF